MLKLSNFQKLLAVFIAFISGMIICRMLYSGSIRFIFLFWNLFLAWIPFRISLYVSHIKTEKKLPVGLLLAGWLLFFPNALYIVTDLIHLEARTNVPLWYDAILLFTSAIAGLLMAFASLYKVEQYFYKKIGYTLTNPLIYFFLFLGSFGVYLGRFLRLNSWDILTNPVELVREISLRLFYPFEYYRTWIITLFFTFLFSLLYISIKGMSVNGVSLKQENGMD
jgi:uncharacterized membrane protein